MKNKMKNKIIVLTYYTILDYYRIDYTKDVNHIFKKGCGDFLTARIVNNTYTGILFKIIKL